MQFGSENKQGKKKKRKITWVEFKYCWEAQAQAYLCRLETVVHVDTKFMCMAVLLTPWVKEVYEKREHR